MDLVQHSELVELQETSQWTSVPVKCILPDGRVLFSVEQTVPEPISLVRLGQLLEFMGTRFANRKIPFGIMIGTDSAHVLLSHVSIDKDGRIIEGGVKFVIDKQSAAVRLVQ